MAKSSKQSNKDQEFEAVCRHMGVVIANWGGIEDELCRTFQFAFGISAFEYSAEAYHAVISLEARLAMVDAVVTRRTKANDALRNKWAALLNRIEKKARKRAEVAHAQILVGSKDGKHEGVYAVPFWAHSRQFTRKGVPKKIRGKMDVVSQNQPALTASDLISRALSFKKLREDIDDFNRELIEYVTSHEKSTSPGAGRQARTRKKD
jgi:hypothetical protein